MNKIALALAAVTLAPAAQAATYTTEAAFQTAATGTALTLESFEANAGITGAPVVFAGGTATCTGGSYCSYFSGTRSIGQATDGAVSVYFATPDTITFTFDSAITAFGIDIVGVGTAGATDFSVSYSGGTTTLVSNYTGGPNLFAGIVDAGGFTSVSFTGTADGDGVDFDRLQYGFAAASGGVPEPATWALMILGMGAVGGAMRRRSAQRTAVRFA